jgi:crossover junction endodeoxyribonuclease RuvC
MPIKKTSNRILGIDPGYGRVGIAILENENNKQKLLHSECFETDSELEQPERLNLITKRLEEVNQEFKPNILGIETLLWSKNKKTALKVAEARGAILNFAAANHLEIFQFNPNQIKLAVTGYGKADKKQMIKMIDLICKPNHKIKYDDEYDAIATAITCAVIHKN